MSDDRDEGPGGGPEPPFVVGETVRVIATGATGVVVEIFRRFASADVDVGDGVTVELGWDELAAVGRGQA